MINTEDHYITKIEKLRQSKYILFCPECEEDKILYDEFRDETFCKTCGLILKQTPHNNRVDQIIRQDTEETIKNKNHKETIIKYDKKGELRVC